MLPSSFWSAITRLGEAQILLPAMLAAVLWLGVRAGAPRPAWTWVAAVAVAAVLTTVSKVAFIGWGIGYAPWNLAGVSGHSMFAAAVLPMLALLAVASAGPAARRLAVAGAVALAAVIAWSRVEVGAHSRSEVLIGFGLGLCAAMIAVRVCTTTRSPWSPLLVGVLGAWLLLMPIGAPPSRTHDWVTQLSLALSGREEPYTRRMMLRAYREELRERGEPLPPPWRKRRVPEAGSV